jgi:hypothetical protein
MDERARRIGINEAVFRELNDQLFGLTPGDGTITCVCECGEIACVETIVLTHDEYHRVRADETTFAVRPGHVKPDVEDVVETHDGYEIVRKREGAAAELARKTA